MDENYIISKGWEKSGWMNGNIKYIHKNFNYLNDQFFIEMKTQPDGYVEIYEEIGNNTERIFRGYLKSNEDLDKIMELLEFDFSC